MSVFAMVQLFLVQLLIQGKANPFESGRARTFILHHHKASVCACVFGKQLFVIVRDLTEKFGRGRAMLRRGPPTDDSTSLLLFEKYVVKLIIANNSLCQTRNFPI